MSRWLKIFLLGLVIAGAGILLLPWWLGAALISHTCNRTGQLALTSYDRLFPNQDTLPKGGFGNLVALPLQNKPREKGYSVFVSEDFVPYPDQWAFLVKHLGVKK